MLCHIRRFYSESGGLALLSFLDFLGVSFLGGVDLYRPHIAIIQPRRVSFISSATRVFYTQSSSLTSFLTSIRAFCKIVRWFSGTFILDLPDLEQSAPLVSCVAFLEFWESEAQSHERQPLVFTEGLDAESVDSRAACRILCVEDRAALLHLQLRIPKPYNVRYVFSIPGWISIAH